MLSSNKIIRGTRSQKKVIPLILLYLTLPTLLLTIIYTIVCYWPFLRVRGALAWELGNMVPADTTAVRRCRRDTTPNISNNQPNKPNEPPAAPKKGGKLKRMLKKLLISPWKWVQFWKLKKLRQKRREKKNRKKSNQTPQNPTGQQQQAVTPKQEPSTPKEQKAAGRVASSVNSGSVTRKRIAEKFKEFDLPQQPRESMGEYVDYGNRMEEAVGKLCKSVVNGERTVYIVLPLISCEGDMHECRETWAIYHAIEDNIGERLESELECKQLEALIYIGDHLLRDDMLGRLVKPPLPNESFGEVDQKDRDKAVLYQEGDWFRMYVELKWNVHSWRGIFDRAQCMYSLE